MPEDIQGLPDLSSFYFKTNFISMTESMHLMSPVRQRLSAGGTSEAPSLKDLGAVLGMDLEDELVVQLIEQHEKRFRTYRLVHTLFSWLGYFLFAGIAFGLLAYLAIFLLEIEAEPGFFLTSLVILLAYVSFKSASRVVSIVFDRYYADTLSFIAGLYLLANLARRNSLLRSGERGRILKRIRALRRYLNLLPYQFGLNDPEPHGWAGRQFRRMEAFVEAKENQIIAPTTNSQAEIFAELRTLVEILLTGRYGEFTYEGPSGEEPVPAPGRPARFAGALKLLGFITPLFLVLAVFLFPEQLSFLGIERNVISYISLAWLLLAIDANLKLGIVQGLSNLAKTIKDLS
jgi:hypothetical protein